MRCFSSITILFAVTLIFSMIGCGGSSGGSGGTATNQFAGTYDGSAALDNGKTGTIGVEVDEDGSVSGTIVVTAPPGTPAPMAADGFPLGTYAITGQADSGGLISLGGLVPPETPFTVTGGLPDGAGSHAITIALGQQTFPGTVQVQSAEAGGNVTMELIQVGNIKNPVWSSVPLLKTNVDEDGYLKVYLTETIGNESRSFVVAIPDTMQAGDSVQLDLTHPRKASYSQFSWVDALQYGWAAVSGTMTLVSRNGDKVSLLFNNARFEPDTFPSNHATGIFIANGSFHN
jgi:hypothetical protein